MAEENKASELAGKAGHGKAFPTPNDAYGQPYKDNVEAMPMEQKLPLQQMPKGADPSPFKLGPMSPGGR